MTARSAVRLLLAVTAAATSLVGLAGPAAAGPGVNPAAYCEDHHFTFVTWDGRERDAWWIPLEAAGTKGQYRFPVESAAGCISTVASGMRDGWVAGASVSMPAARAQCEYLESELGLKYPTVMLRTPVHNRSGCAHVLLGALAVIPPPASGPPL
jgi:hypothetical protein